MCWIDKFKAYSWNSVPMNANILSDFKNMVKYLIVRRLSTPTKLKIIFIHWFLPQLDSDSEWKFCRADLMLSYFVDKNVLPVPYNLIPTRDSFSKLLKYANKLLVWMKNLIHMLLKRNVVLKINFLIKVTLLFF